MTQEHTVGKIEQLTKNEGIVTKFPEWEGPFPIVTLKRELPDFCLGSHIRITEQGFIYKGELIEDAGECYRKLMEFLGENTPA